MDTIREQRLHMEAEEMAAAAQVEQAIQEARGETDPDAKEKLWHRVEDLEEVLKRLQRRDRPIYPHQEQSFIRYGEGAWAGHVFENGVMVR